MLGQGCLQVIAAGHFFQRFPVHVDVFTGVIQDVNHGVQFLRADLHPVCSLSFKESVGEVLEFTAGATCQIYIIS
ncbi:hypothetical protein DPMN_055622 [Dreissena polymorpha]|uniref:Uncharacterized protein n=1 Tax=Dreissena polymorpha TaxID=45954 RepID=A0A9D4CR40_DREPO|nr:hypothetical protein DPMN_055622 [Dreissena polymorpha]